MLLGFNSGKPSIDTGHSNTLTKSTYIGVSEIISNPEYLWANVFPNNRLVTDAKDQTLDLNRKHRFSDLTCRSLDGSLTGATRAEVIITFDDTVTGIEEAMSIERLNSKWAKVTNDALSRKKLNCKELWLNTDWSLHDPLNRRRKENEDNPRARFVKLPALNEHEESNFNYAHEVGFDTKYYLDMRNTLDEASWSALFMQEPIERKGLLYPADELRRFYDYPAPVEKADAIIGVVDTKTTGEDYYVCWIGYNFGGMDWYIEVPVCDNNLDDVVEPKLVSALLDLQPQVIEFESNSAGGKIAESVQKQLREKNCRTSVSTTHSSANKLTRIIVNASWVKKNCLFRNPKSPKNDKGYSFNGDYATAIKFLTTYTMSGKQKFDDVPDAAAMFAAKAQSLVGRKVEIFSRPF